MQVTHSLTTLVAGVLIISACGGSAEPTAIEPPLFTVPPTAPPPDLEVCRADADAGIEATRLAMGLAEGVEPSSLVAGRWTTTLGEQDQDLADLLEEVNSTERQCASAEALSVMVIDRSDEIAPISLESAIIWFDTFGPLTGVARNVDPADAGDYVGANPGDGVEYPTALDLASITSCDEIRDGLLAQISGFQAVWNELTPLDLAAARPALDPGSAIQSARLRSAELGCNVYELSEAALLAIATAPSTSFVGRAQRLTYGQWILDTMVAPFFVNEDDVMAEPVGGAEGLAGFSVINRSESTRSGVSLTVDGEPILQGRSLAPGQSVWVPFAGDRAIPEYDLTWSD